MIGPNLPNKLKRLRPNNENHEIEPALKRSKITESKNEIDERMHPRNVYRYNKPNYYKLSLKYPFFADVLQQNSKTGEYFINFKDPLSNVMLTKVLLKNDFDLDFEHPINRLCPPTTQRLNYLLWIQDLLQCIKPKPNDRHLYHGLDIGVGASCIFPLLGIRIGEQQNEKWTFIASDIDEKSVEFAKKNASINGLKQKIKIIHQKDAKHIFKGIISHSEHLNFSVCNPPFFEHLEECGHNKSRSNNATASELVFDEGGEIGFIRLMVAEIEELKLHHRIDWFSSMLGKKSSIKIIKAMLNKKGAFVVTTEFFQGRQVRWGLAWTFSQKIKTEYNALFNNEYSFKMMVPRNAKNYNKCFLQKVKSILGRYGIKYEERMFKKSENGQIRIDDEETNGFVFSFKWIISANETEQGIELSITVSFEYHTGDRELFNGFIKWLNNNRKFIHV